MSGTCHRDNEVQLITCAFRKGPAQVVVGKRLVGVGDAGDAVSVNEFLRYIIDAIVVVGGNDTPLVLDLVDVAGLAVVIVGLLGRELN